MFVAALQSRFFLKSDLSRKSPHDDASSLGAWVWPSPWLRPWWWWSKVQARAQALFALSTRHLVNFNEIIFSSQMHNMTTFHLLGWQLMIISVLLFVDRGPGCVISFFIGFLLRHVHSIYKDLLEVPCPSGKYLMSGNVRSKMQIWSECTRKMIDAEFDRREENKVNCFFTWAWNKTCGVFFLVVN